MINRKGIYKIKCIKPGGVTLTNYGHFVFAQNEEIDLLDLALPRAIYCANWPTAENMCKDKGFELAQRIAAGEFIITETRKPEIIE